MNSSFTGSGVALVTPFSPDGSIDFEGLKKLLHHVVSGKSDYVVVNGTTAESPTVNGQECDSILRFVKEHIGNKIPIVLGVGGNNTAEVLVKIEKTDFSGVAGILSVSPYYNKPSQNGIFLHYSKIADKSPVPVLLYNVPGRTGSNISAKTTIKLSEHPNIAGIKEANSDLTHSLEIIKYARKGFSLISGDDMLTVPMIALGGKGVISVLANAFPSQFSAMVKHSLENRFKEAVDILKLFTSLNPLMYEEGNPVGIKFVLQQLGITSDHVRLPLATASDELKVKIKEALKEIV